MSLPSPVLRVEAFGYRKWVWGTFWPPWVRPWDNRGKCYMDRKRIQCWSNALQHIPIYLQPFTSYSEIFVGNCNFSYPVEFNAPIGSVPIGIPEKSIVLRKLESWGYQAVKTVWRWLSCFDILPASDGRTDRQTDGRRDVQPIAITCAVWLTHVKNHKHKINLNYKLQRRNGWSCLLNSERGLWYDGRCGWFENFESARHFRIE